MTRVLVTGGRTWTDRRHVFAVLSAMHAADTIDVLIHGAAMGLDSIAAEWARVAAVPALAFPADWQAFGKAAGPIRNRRMIAEGRPDVVMAWPGGRGTADMIRAANAARVPVVYSGEDWG